MKIGIIGAMRCETDKLKSMLTDIHTENISGVQYVSGKLGKYDAVIATCGVGKVFAAICAQTMILRFSPDVIINTGVGGSLSPDLHVCDIAVSTNVVQHDMDTSPLGDPIGLISGINIVYIPACGELADIICKTANECGINSKCGTIASGDAFICSAEKKHWISSNFGAIACEMEGAAIGQVSYVNNVPFVVIRAISDGGDDDASMSYEQFSEIAAENSIRIISTITEKNLLNF